MQPLDFSAGILVQDVDPTIVLDGEHLTSTPAISEAHQQQEMGRVIHASMATRLPRVASVLWMDTIDACALVQ
jgi:hypothetical protein